MSLLGPLPRNLQKIQMDQPFVFFQFQDFKIRRRHILVTRYAQAGCAACRRALQCFSPSFQAHQWGDPPTSGEEGVGEDQVKFRSDSSQNSAFRAGWTNRRIATVRNVQRWWTFVQRAATATVGSVFSLLLLMLAVTGDCGDDGCLCNIKIQCKEKNEKEPETEIQVIPYVIFVFLLTPAPFSADTKNTLIPNFLKPKYTKFKIFTPKHTNSHFFDTRLRIWHRWCRRQISGMLIALR